jgi:hypothetical protein
MPGKLGPGARRPQFVVHHSVERFTKLRADGGVLQAHHGAAEHRGREVLLARGAHQADRVERIGGDEDQVRRGGGNRPDDRRGAGRIGAVVDDAQPPRLGVVLRATRPSLGITSGPR